MFKSDKLRFIDKTTFEDIVNKNEKQENTLLKPIRNTKYKRSRITLSLLDYIKPKPTKGAGKRQCRIGVAPARKKRGKVREGGRKKNLSRIKKSILKYRQRKKDQIDLCVEKTTALLEDLVLSETQLDNSKPVSNEKANIIVKKIHSLRFREYCDNCTTPQLAELVDKLLRELKRFQDRAFERNSTKARAHRRYIIGLRQVQYEMPLKSLKLVIIAPDCERCPTEGGTDESITKIKEFCQKENIPYVFSLRRRQLAYSLFKKAVVSCVGILNYDGAQEIYTDLIKALAEARIAYQELLKN